MKRETKKVTKKTAKRPARKRARRQPDLTLDDVVRAAMKEGMEVHVETAPIQPRKVDVHYPEVWGEEVGRAAKVLGIEPVDIHAKLSALLPKHYPNHLRMLEAIVEQERAAIAEKRRPFHQEEEQAYKAGRKLGDEEERRIAKLEEKIRERREIIEPGRPAPF